MVGLIKEAIIHFLVTSNTPIYILKQYFIFLYIYFVEQLKKVGKFLYYGIAFLIAIRLIYLLYQLVFN